MDRAAVYIAYDGAALKSGSMDVQELAPALLALGELLETSNAVLNGERSRISVRVRSDFKTGSFEISLDVIQKFADQLAFWIGKGDKPWTAQDILKFVGLCAGSGISLIGLLKLLRGRKVKPGVEVGNDTVRIQVDGDRNHIDVHKSVYVLSQDNRVRTSLKKALKPVEREGVDEVQILDNRNGLTEVVEVIGKTELPYFDPPKAEEYITENKVTILVDVLGVSFEENRKWSLFDGQQKYSATIRDEVFLRRVDGGEPFSKGDRLKIELLIRQVATPSGIRIEHEVIQVLEHWRASEQLRFLPDDEQ